MQAKAPLDQISVQLVGSEAGEGRPPFPHRLDLDIANETDADGWLLIPYVIEEPLDQGLTCDAAVAWRINEQPLAGWVTVQGPPSFLALRLPAGAKWQLRKLRIASYARPPQRIEVWLSDRLEVEGHGDELKRLAGNPPRSLQVNAKARAGQSWRTPDRKRLPVKLGAVRKIVLSL